MNHCRTCRFWKPLGPSESQWDGVREKRGGKCQHVRINEYGNQELNGPSFEDEDECSSDRRYHDDALVYPYTEGIAHLWTGPDFGCVHHEPKQG